MKILAIDIETRPSLAYVWGLWDENIPLDRLIEAGEMICWAAKWLGDKKVEFKDVTHDGKSAMIQRAWELLDEADAVTHYNGKSFDVPYLQRAFLEEGLTPPSPYQQIDLFHTVKRQFNFPSNKLQYAAEYLLGDTKTKHSGFDLWIKCMEGDETAWKLMKKYNIHDVDLTEKLYYKLQPWIKAHPSEAAFAGEDVCPKCGGTDLGKNGFVFLRTGRYQAFKCKGCGAHSRSTKRFDGVKITEALNS